MDELKNFTLAFYLAKNIGFKTKLKLIQKFEGIENLYRNYELDLIPEVIRVNITNINIDEILNNISKRNVRFVCFWENGYPDLLKAIDDYPLVLFYVGNLDIANTPNIISIVGTRQITSYGKQILNSLVPPLVQSEFSIVSGMAFGVDAYTHNLVIDNNGPTIAVLPSAIDDPSPRQHYYLYDKILNSNGLVLSEFPLDSKIMPNFFIRRNRIIAGLSKATIVIEAGIKSGSLTTANLAFDYNREVYAYPSGINAKFSEGCNSLIKKNIANLITSPTDIPGVRFDKSSTIMNSVEQEVYCAILRGSKNLDDLINNLNLDINLINEICTKLEINGILNTDDRNNYYVT